MQHKAWKRLLAIFVVIAMLIGLIPVSVYAAPPGQSGNTGNQGATGNNYYKVYFRRHLCVKLNQNYYQYWFW